MRQKLITLDPTSFEIASKMPNFSDWVRRQLYEFHNNNQPTLEELTDKEKFRAEYKLRHGKWPRGEEE